MQLLEDTGFCVVFFAFSMELMHSLRMCLEAVHSLSYSVGRQCGLMGKTRVWHTKYAGGLGRIPALCLSFPPAKWSW